MSTVPIYGFYGYSYSQILYTATDITGGYWAGNAIRLLTFSFYLNTAPATPANDNNAGRSIWVTSLPPHSGSGRLCAYKRNDAVLFRYGNVSRWRNWMDIYTFLLFLIRVVTC